ncbi:MAG: 2-succinyl-5-enolpyruvyl-6-hydroxy-3-cyclohexene-1-carboxylic-acid synthase, partial [Bacteroidota bacterium]
MIYSKIPLAQTVVELCKQKGIAHIVISPGSRNAPLTIGFSNDNFFKCYSIVDERCAAFFGMGIAQQTQTPVALVCTSGSALLNYYPAISEAFYSDIPLVVLSADRPKHLLEIGDGQTIIQKNVYDKHVHYSTDLKVDLKDEHRLNEKENIPLMKNLENKIERFLGIQKSIQKFNESEINTALNLSVIKQGPVHINVPFDEPLYDVLEKPTVKPKLKKIEYNLPKIEANEIKYCVDEWYAATKKMVLVGALQPGEIDIQWLDELANDNSVVVFTETTSNIQHPDFFVSIDKMIAPMKEDDFRQLQPDILLTFGGMIVSKKVKRFLRDFQPKHHWHVDERKANDTFFCLSKHIEQKPNTFLSEFLPKISHTAKSRYLPTWIEVKKHRHRKHLDYLKQIPFSDFKVFDALLKNLPNKSLLQLGNSSTVRYAQLFRLNNSIEVFCNRGTSGIDGCTSTAIGAAVAVEKQTVFITGDLSFFYDSNALWNNYIPNNFRIIVINNGGGGIFRILPGAEDTENFERYFETKHDLNAVQLCEMFNFEYFSAKNESEMEHCLKTFYNKSKKPRLLEVFTPRK